jgi:hypothetical protein
MRSAPTKHYHCSQFPSLRTWEERACGRDGDRDAERNLSSPGERESGSGLLRQDQASHRAASSLGARDEGNRQCHACSDEAAQHFLDSRYGRHLADEVVNALIGRLELPAAIDSAVAHWMRRRIDSRIQDELGIPEGWPYRTGFVCMHEALLETNG